MAIMLSFVYAQSKSIKGTVVDNAGEPLPGATIQVEGTTMGATTDIDGKFSLEVEPGARLSISFIGKETQTVLVGEETSLNITLLSDVKSLEQIVVVGYGSQTQKTLTTAVSTVKSAAIQGTKSQRVEQALQGSVAGVRVVSESGQPGEGLKVRIRGVSTTGNSDPLYIVDGMPTGDVKYLNPNDIVSISVLKDAAAAAIYGSRGANGVILITTMQPQTSTLKIAYNGYYGIQNAWKKMDLLNAREYATIMNEAYFNSGKSPLFSAAEIEKLGDGTDWQNEIFSKNAIEQNHVISLNGGSEKNQISSSVSYFESEGIIAKDKSNYTRTTFRINSVHWLYKDKVSIGQNLTYSREQKKGIDINNEFGSPLSRALNMDPVTPVGNPDDGWGESKYASQEVVNPVAGIYYTHGGDVSDKVLGNIFAEIKIIKGLKFKTNYGIDFSYNVNDGYQPKYRISTTVKSDINNASREIKRWYTWNWENTLTYQKQIKQHNITALIGMTANEYEYKSVYGSRQNLLIDDPKYAYIDNTTDLTSAQVNGGIEQARLLSYFGRVNYNFGGKYLFSATLRSDGSSKFGTNNRYAFFPSASVGWIVTGEDFGKINNIDFLKLRAGWGQNGNQEIGDFRYLSTISSDSRYTFGKDKLTTGSSPSAISNPNLRWETSEQFNIGIEGRFLGSKLYTEIDLYQKTTKDWLVDAPISGVIGNDAPTVNGGSVRNRGVEVTLGYNFLVQDFRFDVNANMAYNQNEVTSIDNSEGIIHGPQVNTNMRDVARAQTGYPIGYFYGYESDGLYQNQKEVDASAQPDAKPGDLRLVDQNGDGKIDDNDKKQIGDPNPDVTYGINISINYKAFDFACNFTGVAGNEILNMTRRYDLPTSNYHASVLGRWHGEGTSNTIPRVTVGDNLDKFSDYFLEDGSYLRLQNISLGYDFAKDLLKVKNVSKIRLYVSARNLLTFTSYTGMDPDVGSGKEDYDWVQGIDVGFYPRPRTYLVGLNVTF